nr:MAG TPA: putative periplasmic lipoprotein [Crassvirales sp.]
MKVLERTEALLRKVPLLSTSNREKHFLYAIPFGLIFTILFVAGLAFGMEYKDKLKGGKFDNLDFLCTILGGIIGQILQLALYMIIR